MNTKRRAHCQLWHDWKERIIRIGDEQTSLQNQFDNFRNEYSDYPALIEGLETTVNGLDGRLIIAESDIADAENRISACESDIDSLETEVNALDGRVTITESDIAAAENRISTCESDIDSLESEVNSLDGRVSITESDIVAAENRISTCESDIDSLESNVNALDGRVTITESDISDAESRITACEADIDRIDAELVDKTGEINNLSNRMTLAEADIDYIDARLDGIETGEILLSQLNVDADKDMAGRTLSNVKINANEVTVRGSQIDPTRINNLILLWDGQERIDARQNYRYSGNLEYITSSDDDPAPCRTYMRINYGLIDYEFRNKFPIKPGSRITMSLKYRKRGGNYFSPYYAFYDADGILIKSRYMYTAPPDTDIWTTRTYTLTAPDNAHFFGTQLEVACDLDVCDWKVWADADMPITLGAKTLSADGVIIKDGGTVDGVDVSTHAHDGTAIGGPKISYNDLVDKPTIPRPPMPYIKRVSINLADPSDYIDVLDIIPEGRTALTVEQLQYRNITNIAEGTGQFVDIGIIYDDNTNYHGIDRITKNGDTEWHPPTFYMYNPGYHFTKNYIIGIQIKRTYHEGPKITGYVDIFGHVY